MRLPDVRECPCCGKPGKLKDAQKTTRRGSFRQGWVGCPACGLYIQWAHDPRWAIEKWNRRFTDARLKFREPPLAIAGLDPRIPDGHGRLIL